MSFTLKGIMLLLIAAFLCHTRAAHGASTTLPEGRLSPNPIFYSTNTLIRLNSRYTFPSPNSDKTNLWLLTRQPAQPPSPSAPNSDNPPLVLYDAASQERNSSLLDHYQCSPSNENCAQLTIPRFNLQDIGVYSLQTRSSNYLTFTYVSYNVSAYDLPINLSCDNSSTCLYNTSTQTLSVLPYQPINVTCTLVVVQNDEYPIPATLNLYSNGEECASAPTVYTPIPSPAIGQLFNQSTTNNLNFIRMSKTCQRTFNKQETNPNYSCYLNPTPLDSGTPTVLQQTNTYEKLVATADIHHGPDYSPSSATFNKTLILGQGTVLTCPFVGNPTPSYYWRVVSVNTNNQTGANNRRMLTPARDFSLSSQDYNIPKDLQIGAYVFECKSFVGGLVNKESQTVQFHLSVIPPPVIAKKASVSNFESRFIQNGSKIGAIVGGTVGGVAVLVIIVVAVIFLLKFRRSRKEPRDETEKPKDSDKAQKRNKNKSPSSDKQLDLDIGGGAQDLETSSGIGGFSAQGDASPNTNSPGAEQMSNNEHTATTTSTTSHSEVGLGGQGQPRLPQTSPPASISSSRRNLSNLNGQELNENSSLAMNKMSNQQGGGSSPGGRRDLIKNQFQTGGSNTGLNRLAPTDQSGLRAPGHFNKNEIPGELTSPNINQATSSAHEYFYSSSTQVSSQRQNTNFGQAPINLVKKGGSNQNSNQNLSTSTSPIRTSEGFYSPSSAEANLENGAAADANLSSRARMARQDPTTINNNSNNLNGAHHHHHHHINRNGAINGNIGGGEQSNQQRNQNNNNNNNNTKQQATTGSGIGHKVIAGLMVPTQTAQSYAAIAHAAAAAAQSNSFNQQRHHNLSASNSSNQLNGDFGGISTNPNQASGEANGTINTNFIGGGSVNNLFGGPSNIGNSVVPNKTQSYNNPGFFDSTSYTIPNNLELPPPYDSALQQPIKKDSPIQQQQQQQQQQLIQQQQKDYMGSSSKLISGSNTPTLANKHTMPATSHSYTAMLPSNLSVLNQQQQTLNSGMSLQQLQYHQQQQHQQQQHQHQQQANLQYTTVQNLENRARSRNPLNALSDMDQQQQQQPQYTTITTAIGQLSTTPIDV